MSRHTTFAENKNDRGFPRTDGRRTPQTLDLRSPLCRGWLRFSASLRALGLICVSKLRPRAPRAAS